MIGAKTRLLERGSKTITETFVVKDADAAKERKLSGWNYVFMDEIEITDLTEFGIADDVYVTDDD